MFLTKPTEYRHLSKFLPKISSSLEKPHVSDEPHEISPFVKISAQINLEFGRTTCFWQNTIGSSFESFKLNVMFQTNYSNNFKKPALTIVHDSGILQNISQFFRSSLSFRNHCKSSSILGYPIKRSTRKVIL